MTALQIGAQIKQGKIKCIDIVSAVFNAINEKDNKLNAYITINKEAVLSRACEVQKLIDESVLTSPIAGVPISVKDNICVKGIRTTCASKMLENFVPVYNATVIDRLEAAGAIILGKLNMDEFAMGSTSETSYFGAVRNPWNTERVAGGSSGGSAAAVCAREAIIALGSDTGGSVRQPAAYCGVTGFKPTYGTVSRYGLIAYASSLDQIGPIGRDVADCAAIMDIISGQDEKDSTSVERLAKSYLDSLDGNIKGLRIALPKQCFEGNLDSDVKKAVLKVSEELIRLGASVEYVDFSFLEYVVPTYYIIASAEASSNLSRFDGIKYGFRAPDCNSIEDIYRLSRSKGFGNEVKKRILLGTFVLSSGYFDAYYRKALKVKSIIKDSFEEIFSRYDAILCPTTPSSAPLLNESLKDPLGMYLSDVYTVSANLAGLPAISIPCGFDENNMPIGAQIIGPVLQDKKVLNIGFSYQQVTDFHNSLPEVLI